MDFRYKITIRGWDNEAGEYTDATEQVWERTNEKLTAQEFIEEYELPHRQHEIEAWLIEVACEKHGGCEFYSVSYTDCYDPEWDIEEGI